MTKFLDYLIALILALAIVNLLSIPFWLFGGAKWGLSANAVLSFCITVLATKALLSLVGKWEKE